MQVLYFGPSGSACSTHPFEDQTNAATDATVAGRCRGRRRPNLSLLADRCASARALRRIHAAMLVSGRLASDPFAASRLLAAYAALSPASPLPALRLLSSLPYAPTSFMLNTVLRTLASSPVPSAAFTFFSRARLDVPPGRHTFPFLLKAAARLPLAASLQVHALVLKSGLILDAYVANGLVRAYSVACLVSVARKVFDELLERNVAVYTTMISGYAQSGRCEDAVEMFDAMVGEGIEPGGPALTSVLSACARSGGLEAGCRVHEFMEGRGMMAPLGVILGTALVDMYVKNGAIGKAMVVFEGMLERNTATWNVVISGMAHHGYGKGALGMFRWMQQEGVSPNAITLVGVLSACCHAGLQDDACRVFGSMERDFGVMPSIQHYNCMVDLLGRSGQLAEAEEMIRGMTCNADVTIWGALLKACKNHSDIEIAERVVQEMLKLDPGNHGVYVVLSNMYAEAGKWHDVSKLRRAIRKVRLSKIPGSSTVAGDC